MSPHRRYPIPADKLPALQHRIFGGGTNYELDSIGEPTCTWRVSVVVSRILSVNSPFGQRLIGSENVVKMAKSATNEGLYHKFGPVNQVLKRAVRR